MCIGCGADFLQKTSASYCRSCHSARSMESARRWKAANPEAAHLRKKATHLRKYGLTLTEYDAMLEKQGGGCAVCGSKSSGKRKLSVDHCHKTGAVRGLLCGNCNYILGHADDRPALLRSAASYLEERQ